MRLLAVVLAGVGCATVSPLAQSGSHPPLQDSEAGSESQPAADPVESMPTPIDAFWSDLGDAFWGYNLLYYGGAVAATGVMSQSGADREVRGFASDIDGGAWSEAANIGGYVVPLVTAPTIWIAGLVSDHRTVAGAGSAVILALGVTVSTTGLLKVATGRPHPGSGGEVDDSDLAREFEPFQNDLGAWPSGHTASTISIAAALTAYAPEKWWIPIIGYPLGLAFGAGMIERDSHWASDVLAGALLGHGIGYSIGRNFRRRVRGESMVEQSLRVVPLSGARGLAIGARW